MPIWMFDYTSWHVMDRLQSLIELEFAGFSKVVNSILSSYR